MSGPSNTTWLYPWDIHDLGVSRLSALLTGGEVDIVNVATSYHSLFATIPDNPCRRQIELLGSALYYRPDPAVWAGSFLPLTVSPMVDEVGDALDLARDLADSAGCAVSAWTVCLHDTSLGRLCPDMAVETLWGDRLSVAPCLQHPDVRDYARRLVADVADRADLVQLESPCWTTLPHHRHAKLPARSPDVVARLSELCFCRRCRNAASANGIDVDRLAGELRARWEAAHSVAVSFTQIVDEVDGFAEFLRVRADAVTHLVGQLVAASPVPVEIVTFGDRIRTGMNLAELEDTGAAVWLLAYGRPEQVEQVLTDEADACDRPKRVQVGLSLLPEHTESAADLATSVRLAVDCGVDSIGTYHLGLATAQRRDWLRQVPAARRAAARSTGGDR